MKGILFKPESIKAIIEGRKTQTRRVIKPQLKNPSDISYENGVFTYKEKVTYDGGFYLGEWQHIKPRYQVGEVVYVKEAYWQDQSGGLWGYKLDGIEWPPLNCGGKATSPMFMPKWAARYFIKITDVRAERLEEITEEDARAEGCIIMVGVTSGGSMGLASARYDYMNLWNSINPKYPWESNPWVFVYSFMRDARRLNG